VEQIEQRGVDVVRAVELLARAAAGELRTYYAFSVLRMHLAGREGLKQTCEDARLAAREHFELVVPRVYELGGALPSDLGDLSDRGGWPDASRSDGDGDGARPGVADALEVMLEASRSAIRAWSEIWELTVAKDPRTSDLAGRILGEEVAREAALIELLARERDGVARPSGGVGGG